MGEYVLGASDREIERLAYQHEVWLDDTLKLWKKAGIGLGSHVADFGCGPGFCSEGLSRLVGNKGAVTAVDMSEKFASLMDSKTEKLTNLRFESADVTKTSVPEASIDAVFCRWLFSFLPSLEDGVEEARRVLKPGGRLVILDYFNYLAANVFPTNEAVSKLFEAFTEDVKSHGGSWETGGELPKLMASRGFEIESLMPICRIARPGSREWRWVEYFIEVTTPRLVETKVWTESERSEFESEWKKTSETEGAFLFTPPMIGIVGRKLR